ncbi:hypothetical protein FRB96_004903 [Tulasnella sp. 330]|nr:hypothetical protein FRB96_004903 [Tulasnella sp. 330]
MSLANESADTRMVALRLPLVPYRTPPESSMDDPEARQRHARAAPPDPPPYPRAFTSYETSLKTDVYRTVSCDPYLNNDGEALYRFLLTQSAKPPTFIVECLGTYESTTSGRKRPEDETLTSFHFRIRVKLVDESEFGPPIFVLGDGDTIFRGSQTKQVDSALTVAADVEAETGTGKTGPKWRRKASEAELEAEEARSIRGKRQGIPPWVPIDGEMKGTEACIDSEDARHRFRSTSFKEFNFDKVVYGWDLGRLRDRIQKTLEDNWDADKMRGPKVKVQFNLIGNVVSVRSNSWMTHVLDHRRFSAAQWHVAGAAYALARWVHLEGSSPGEGFEAFCSRTGRLATDDLAITPWGVAKLVGVTEEDWFNAWESTFVDFARRKMKADAGAVMDNPPEGEALYRFLLEQAEKPPVFLIGCKGVHYEYNSNGGRRTVTDFCFYLRPHLLQRKPPIFVVGDRIPAHRGRISKEIDAPVSEHDPEAGAGASGSQWRRKASQCERREAKENTARMSDQGLPPWALAQGRTPGVQASIESEQDRYFFQSTARGPAGVSWDDSMLQPPSKSLREWADDYCTSKKLLKEFNFDKVVYGWNLDYLRGKIHRTVRANWDRKNKDPRVIIFFEVSREVVSVRPESWLSRTLSHKWIRVLLWILFIYPLFVWPFKRYFGGEWRVSGSAYALARWVHLEDSIPGESVSSYVDHARPASNAQLKETPRGISKLEGPTEDAWFNKWESKIADMTKRKVRSWKGVDAPA